MCIGRNIIFNAKCYYFVIRPRGVTVHTLDSESSDRGSNPPEELFRRNRRHSNGGITRMRSIGRAAIGAAGCLTHWAAAPTPHWPASRSSSACQTRDGIILPPACVSGSNAWFPKVEESCHAICKYARLCLRLVRTIAPSKHAMRIGDEMCDKQQPRMSSNSRGSIRVNIAACPAEDPGLIPGRGLWT